MIAQVRPLRNQMKRLFRCSVSLIYEDERGDVSASSQVADRTEFWWNDLKATLRRLFAYALEPRLHLFLALMP